MPSGTGRVVVRGHDQTHDYGGHATIITLETSDTETVQQGPEPQAFGGSGSATTTDS